MSMESETETPPWARLFTMIESINQKMEKMEINTQKLEQNMGLVQQDFSSKITVVQNELTNLRDQVQVQDQLNEAKLVKLETDQIFANSENAAAISAQEDVVMELKSQFRALEEKFEESEAKALVQDPFASRTAEDLEQVKMDIRSVKSSTYQFQSAFDGLERAMEALSE